ncbi:hypothetical protein F441_13023 [Phytophthora nicotianae CJ01A1]|uniref:Uncharacterized protein n=4 Tax=Phytophthora nicotianae TaxID=4792 RepID=V9ER24_PHYNI|nr:hypothetical protein F443_13058 [Phytophthora nicotianae P1569]ETL35168.1 hypothetical protein L916_12668 [Phytophthora nicotianae]ETM41659.1 hypothetical protein L914_12585 [Phytophthora nicotianae]ETP11463.1 hypothetical protein F441_13023 [Phytophthora nicotianae CJ01A1]ETP39584.1 hypothetical protein F442_12951 [Phytophthora nicotianae P10297]
MVDDQTNLAHNLVKHVGFTQTPFVEGSVVTQKKSAHNTTQDIEHLMILVMTEMLSMYDWPTASLTGSAAHDFLLSKGHKQGKSAISRLKMDIDDKLRDNLIESNQE